MLFQNKIFQPRTTDLIDNKKHEINLYHLVLWLTISIIFTVLQIQHSLRQGQLGLPPSYDDVNYFEDALIRLRLFYDNGWLSLLKNYIENPPRSPFSTLIAFLGFAFFGIKDWAPAAINFLSIFLILVLIDYLSGKLPIAWKIFMMITALTWPIIGHLIIECRPDIFCGLLTVSVIIVITEKPWISANKERHFIVGLILGGALLTKPTISPVTLVLAITAMILVTLIEVFVCQYQGKKKQIILPFIRVLGLGILIALPHFLFAFKRTLLYVYQSLVVDKSIWAPERPVIEHIFYYLSGDGGQMMINNWLYIWLLMVAIIGFIIAQRKDWQSIIRVPALVGSMLLAYVIVTHSDHKSPFLGVVFPSFLFFSYILMVTYLIEYYVYVKKGLIRRGLFCSFSVLFITSLLLFTWPASTDTFPYKTIPFIQYSHQRLTRIYQKISENVPQNPQNKYHIFVTSVAQDINGDTFEYFWEKMGDRRFSFITNSSFKSDFTGVAFSDDVSITIKTIQSADFIVGFDQDNPEMFSWMGSSKIQSGVLDFLNNNPDFKLLQSYSNPYRGGTIFLYSRRHLNKNS